ATSSRNTVHGTESDVAHGGRDDEGALREEVAEGNERLDEDRTRLRSGRGVEMGQALLHLPEKERGHHHPAEGRVYALILQRRLAKGPTAHPPKGWRTYAGGPLDSIHVFNGNFGTAANPDEVHRRSHTGREVEKEGSPKEGVRVCDSRGTASATESVSGTQGVVRSPHAGTEKIVHLACLWREAAKDARSAGGEVCANDLERPGVQRVHSLIPCLALRAQGPIPAQNISCIIKYR